MADEGESEDSGKVVLPGTGMQMPGVSGADAMPSTAFAPNRGSLGAFGASLFTQAQAQPISPPVVAAQVTADQVPAHSPKTVTIASRRMGLGHAHPSPMG